MCIHFERLFFSFREMCLFKTAFFCCCFLMQNTIVMSSHVKKRVHILCVCLVYDMVGVAGSHLTVSLHWIGVWIWAFLTCAFLFLNADKIDKRKGLGKTSAHCTCVCKWHIYIFTHGDTIASSNKQQNICTKCYTHHWRPASSVEFKVGSFRVWIECSLPANDGKRGKKLNEFLLWVIMMNMSFESHTHTQSVCCVENSTDVKKKRNT